MNTYVLTVETNTMRYFTLTFISYTAMQQGLTVRYSTRFHYTTEQCCFSFTWHMPMHSRQKCPYASSKPNEYLNV